MDMQKIKSPLVLFSLFLIGLFIGGSTVYFMVTANKKIDWLANALAAERTMSEGAMYEVMAWENYYLRSKNLNPIGYACRFTAEFNPAHSANPSTEQNIEKMLRYYSRQMKAAVGNEPKCYTFGELKLQEVDGDPIDKS